MVRALRESSPPETAEMAIRAAQAGRALQSAVCAGRGSPRHPFHHASRRTIVVADRNPNTRRSQPIDCVATARNPSRS